MVLKPVRIVDIGEIEAWAQGRVIEDAARAISTVGLIEDDARMVMREAFTERRKILFLSSETQGLILQSMEGISRLVWLSARQADPSLTLDDVIDKIGTINEIEELVEIILEQSGFINEEKKTDRMKAEKQTETAE